jgi:hypothetical protein
MEENQVPLTYLPCATIFPGMWFAFGISDGKNSQVRFNRGRQKETMVVFVISGTITTRSEVEQQPVPAAGGSRYLLSGVFNVHSICHG